MAPRALFIILCALALSAVSAPAPAPVPAEQPAFRGGAFTPPRLAPGFTLAGSDGAPLQLERYRGEVVVLAFGFTSCTDVCPITMAVLTQARRLLGAAGEEMQVLYITVDPERDDAERMRSYLANFHPDFIGGTGAPEQLAAVRRDYGVVAEKVVAERGVRFAHSSFTYLIDRSGYLRVLMPYGTGAEDYVHDLRLLLAE